MVACSMVAAISVKFCICIPDVFSTFEGGTPAILKSEFLGLNFGHLTTLRNAVAVLSGDRRTLSITHAGGTAQN